eukprot:1867168-Prymnesium_polylepis.1
MDSEEAPSAARAPPQPCQIGASPHIPPAVAPAVVPHSACAGWLPRSARAARGSGWPQRPSARAGRRFPPGARPAS